MDAGQHTPEPVDPGRRASSARGLERDAGLDDGADDDGQRERRGRTHEMAKCGILVVRDRAHRQPDQQEREEQLSALQERSDRVDRPYRAEHRPADEGDEQPLRAVRRPPTDAKHEEDEREAYERDHGLLDVRGAHQRRLGLGNRALEPEAVRHQDGGPEHEARVEQTSVAGRDVLLHDDRGQ